MSDDPDVVTSYTCDRCGGPVILGQPNEIGRRAWEHAEVSDAIFCGLVMRSRDRQEARDGEA